MQVIPGIKRGTLEHTNFHDTVHEKKTTNVIALSLPKDHTSTLPSYCPSSIASITSGAIQYGVPTNEFAGHFIEALPKSANFTVPFSVSKMLPALTSLECDETRVATNDRFENQRSCTIL